MRPNVMLCGGPPRCQKCYAASGPSAPTKVGRRTMQRRLRDKLRLRMRKRRGDATKCDLRAPTTEWVCQPGQ